MPDIKVETPANVNVQVMKAAAVQQAILEVLQANRVEIIRRAREKLRTLGIKLADSDVG